MSVRPSRLFLALSVLLILVTTLWPIGDAAPQSVGFCVLCGELGTLDFLNNIVLFAPLGAALAWSGFNRSEVALSAFLLSSTVELLQFAVPGRDPSVGDLLANTLGAMLGREVLPAASSMWRARGPRALGLLSCYAVAFVAGMAMLSHIVRPDLPYGALYGQIAPARRDLAPYPGEVKEVEFAGLPLRSDRLPLDWSRAQQLLVDGYSIRAAVGGSSKSISQRTAIARVVGDRGEFILVGLRNDCLLFRQRLRSARVRLRSLTLAACQPALVPATPLAIEAGYRDDSLYVTGSAATLSFGHALRLSAAVGWAAFLPLEMPLSGWERSATLLIFACLGWPLGFFLLRSAQDGLRRHSMAVGATVAAAGLGGGLVAAPKMLGAPYPGLAASTAAVLGSFAGLATAWFALRLRR
jgi:VanZ family protein